MTTAELVNLIVKKFGGNRVEFLHLASYPQSTQVDFRHAGNKYLCIATSSRGVIVRRWDDVEYTASVDNYSRWIEGVLNGCVRNEAGELVEKT